MSVECIYRIEELGQEFNNLVGEKCANLGEMAKIGLQVPPGFSLSIEAYKKFISETGADNIVSLGGATIALIGSQVLSALPFGLPKVMAKKFRKVSDGT